MSIIAFKTLIWSFFLIAGATQNGSAYTGTRMQPVPAASAGISPGNGRSAVTYQPHYGTSGTRSPRDTSNHLPPPATPAGQLLPLHAAK